MKNIQRKIMLLICIVSCIMLAGCSMSGTKIYDKDQNEINKSQDETKAYMQIVEEDAVKILCEQNDCGDEEARKLLVKGKYHIYTYFNAALVKEMAETYRNYGDKKLSFACVATDLNGHLVGVFSGGSEEINFAKEKQAPYSSFKPLSVYLPALEAGTTNWSKTYKDGPFKQIVYANGDKENWPSNATGVYSNKDIIVNDALKTSLNTVAVKCLSEYGVKKTMDFLEERLGLRLDFERKKVEQFGEEEILGNIALGYLEEGVSPVDMAGYYQIFANGGCYQKPKTISKILDADGNVIYQLDENKNVEQTITREASFVMNQLLQNVVSPNGTGANAVIPGVAVGGKTGTGETGNWFVGFTPEYTCAVWHGPELSENYAATMFAETVSAWEHNKDKIYPVCGTVKEAIFCRKSGLLMTEKCSDFELGYYMSVDCPGECDEH